MSLRIIISGGGTGGHVFPALAIANAIKKMRPGTEILFIGAQGKLEMEKVPAAGYPVVGLPVIGMPRKFSFRFISFVIRWIRSLLKARKILKKFRPHAVIGVGGYASAPVLQMAVRMRIITLIQEQNSYAGLVNRSLAAKVNRICVAYSGLEKYFPAAKIVFTGNPVRRSILQCGALRKEALEYFGFTDEMPVVLILGGSLGAGTINRSVAENIKLLDSQNVQVIWQCGDAYARQAGTEVLSGKRIRLVPFIERMEMAYAAADIIISRAGAGTISELCVVGKPAILVPSPNVAEDHQTKNAMMLASSGAALVIPDGEALEKLIPSVLALLGDPERCRMMAEKIKELAVTDADERIAREVFALTDKLEHVS
ncbi:MAG: undecaprenyldiphospho-muramoylpentapeptide beta-N-acetylglucosaminyltransferase [Bacteroidales bacterium]